MLGNFDISSQSQGAGTKLECTFDQLTIPENSVVYAAGGYSGKKVNFQIDQSGHTATQFDIAVNSIERPVILMLGSYEPTVWNIGWSKGTTIVAALVSGYHRQVVAGLPSDTPVIISSHHNQGPCGYFYIGKKKNAKLNPQSRDLFGKDVELVFLGDRKGQIVVGEPLTSTTELITSTKTSPESYRDKNAPLAGKAGLEDAIAKGILRRANMGDANRWVEKLIVNKLTDDSPPIAGKGVPKPPKPAINNAYVVLKPFIYPSGLYGAHSAVFFIEEGVLSPQGKPGHSTIYDFNTISCKGPACRR